MSKIDLTGKRFNRIVILRGLGYSNKKGYWEYQCDCGTIKKADTSTLNAGRIRSCGCLVKETSAKINRKAPGIAPKNRIISDYKKKCKKDNIVWELTDEQFFALIVMNCSYCGIGPTNNSKTICPNSHTQIYWNGIDRVDPKKGYTIDNSVPCCRQCNMAKFRYSLEDFYNWIDRIVKFRNQNDSQNCCNK